MKKLAPTESAAAKSFIESIGLSAQADGLPRIAGRMLGFFVLNGGPCSLSDLAARLQVSRGSISTNARILCGLGIIQRLSKSGDRQDYFQLASNPYSRLLEGYVERMQGVLGILSAVQRDLPEPDLQTRRRLKEMASFYATACISTRALIKKLNEEQNDTVNSPKKSRTG